MNPFTGRLLGYIFLSLFFAFVAGPYTEKRIVSKTGPVVFLSAVALSDSIQQSACPQGVSRVSTADLAPFPKIDQAVDDLSRWPVETNRVSLYGGNLGGFIRRILGQNQRSFCFEHQGRCFRLTWLMIRDIGSLYLIGLKAPPAVPSLAGSDLSEYPRLAVYVKNLEQASVFQKTVNRVPGSIRSTEGMRVPSETRWMIPAARQNEPFYETVRTQIGPKEWTHLNRALGTNPERAVFRMGDYLIMGASQVTTEKVGVGIGWFKIARYLFAALFLFLGLFVMRGIYRRRPGINLNPRWSAVVGDGLFILFSGFGAYCLIEFAMSQWVHMTSFMNEDVVRGMSAIGYLPATAFFAYFSAHQFSQSVEASPEGLRLHYPGEMKMLEWENIEGFDTKESYTVVGRAGTMMPRKLQTKLLIRTAKGDVTLVEPGYRKTKQKLIGAFMRHAPQRLRPDLEKLRKMW